MLRNEILHYLFIGVIIVLGLWVLYMLFFLAIWGGVLGGLIYAIAQLRNFISNRQTSREPVTIENKEP